jgi:outer membrane protein
VKKFAVVLALVPAFFAAQLAAADAKIGVVDVQEVLSKAPQAEAMAEKLKKEFQDRTDGLKKQESEIKAQAEKAQKDAPTMTEAQRIEAGRNIEKLKSDFQFKVKAYQDDIQRRRAEEMRLLEGKIGQAVNAIAAKEGLQLVLRREVVPYVQPDLDITAKVVQALGAPGK